MARWRLRVERWWLRRRLATDMPVLVQTASMRNAVRQSLGRDALVAPFAELLVPVERPSAAAGFRFLYPASGEPHKNHPTLLAAWRLLAQAGVEAELHLTVDHNSHLAEDIARARANGLPVVNHGRVDATSMVHLYQTSTALIFPSLRESFGLPLLEAQAASLPIVAAERDYVRDVVEPAETFDPESPLSIARAVRRLLGTAERPVPPMTPAEFIATAVTPRA
jgi:glycosyltransferase involved in cell wall biosynthesis